MIIYGHEELKVGQITKKLVADMNREYHSVTFLVIREATKQEFLDHLEETGSKITDWEDINRIDSKFYEISTD